MTTRSRRRERCYSVKVVVVMAKAAAVILAIISAALLPGGILALSPLVRYDGTSTTALYSYYSSSPEPRRDEEAQNARQFAVAIDVPTITEREPTRAAQIPPRPKIVVLGASGRIGRRVLKKLLASGIDLDVVAFVRSRERLDQVLYEEEDVVVGTMADNKAGPKLHVVEADVVSRRDVYRKTFETDGETEQLDNWVMKAKAYFQSRCWNYGNSTEIHSLEDDDKVESDVEIIERGEEALREAVSGATVIISCLNTLRASGIWSDFLKVPFVRVFRTDASKWCGDGTHPYYVNYLSTKKVLHFAEEEQRKRDVVNEFEREKARLENQMYKDRRVKEEEGFESEIARTLERRRVETLRLGDERDDDDRFGDPVKLPKKGRRPSANDRIKFIRISNLMVAHSVFSILRPWNVITNVFWSQLTKWEMMVEMLMESTTLIDTIALRPGDLTDEERNINKTTLQVCTDGRVDSPSLVGRDDVADLAVVAALTKTCRNETASGSQDGIEGAFGHNYAWAVRWTGQHLSPPQGFRPDGMVDASESFAKAIQDQMQSERIRNSKDRRLKSFYGGNEVDEFRRILRSSRPFLKSVAVSVPVYSVLGALTWYLFGSAILELVARVRRLTPIKNLMTALLS